MPAKTLKTITQILLLAVVAIVPFVKTFTLYFPFISGKAYVFRLLVALAFFFWVWHSTATRDKRQETRATFKNILVIALVLFFLAQVLVSFFGVDPFFSFFSSIDRQDGVFQYGFWLLYFLILTSVFKEEQDWKKFFLVFITVALLLSVYSWLSPGYRQDVGGREPLEGIFGNPAFFAAFLLFAIGFSLILYERKVFRSRPLKRGLLILAGFFVLTLIFTHVRGAYLGLVGGVFLFCLLSFLFLRKENPEGRPSGSYGVDKKLANWCGIILLAGLVSIVVLFAARNTDFVKNSLTLSRVTEVVKIWEVASVRERLLNWNIVFKAFQEKPIFGWGPENYEAAANKYYDFRIGENEPWFDRAHSQPFDILATGGVILFSFYLFWIFAVFFLIFKIAKKKKILSFVLASIFLAYFLQGFFLFDTLAVYLGLFPFLAYLLYQESRIHNAESGRGTEHKGIKGHSRFQIVILLAAGAFSAFLIYATVIIPWRANSLAKYFFDLTPQGFYKESKPYLEKAFRLKSPYTSWELRKMTAWQLMNVLEEDVSEETPREKMTEIQEIYEFVTPEFEEFIAARPTHPQIYYMLAKIYRLGYEKLDKNDLAKAENVLKRAFLQSDLRVEYFNEFAKVLLLQGKFEEAERIIKAHTERMPSEWGDSLPLVTLGNFYFETEKFEKSLEQYDKAREVGFQIYTHPAVYPRYILASENVGDYERIVEMGQKHLEYKGPDPDTYFNIAVGYFNLGDKEKAKEFFLKAVELNEEYEEYRQFFID